MHLDDQASQREADAQSAARFFHRRVGLFEQLEDTLDLLRGQADARVANAKHDRFPFNVGGEPSATRGVGIFRRVVE